MKPKKKPVVSNKKNSKKPLSSKPLLLIDKTIVTTKEKTHNTIQDPVQIKHNHTRTNTLRNHPNRFNCQEKPEQFSFSPFSSPGGSSVSPRFRKAISPIVKGEKEKKRLKQKPLLQVEKTVQKKKALQEKRQSIGKPKTTKEECNITYQNFVLKRLDEKKITELSQESEISIGKVNKLHLNLHATAKQKNVKLGSKNEKIKELRQKISDKYKRELPSLKPLELNFFCSVVLIQRLWRQKRIKNFINEFISPRSNPQCNITLEIQRENNFSKLETTGTSQEQTSELIRKYHHQSSMFEKKPCLAERQVYSTQMETAKKDTVKYNLKDLQLSAELSPQRQKRMIRYVQCVRDISFIKSVQSKQKYKMNVFNLESSLSQKCLMQSLYLKIFKNSPSKMNNFQVFNSKKEKKQLQRSIQLINSIKSPQKADLIQIQQRFQTQLQSDDQLLSQKSQPVPVKKVQKAQACVDTQGIQQMRTKNEVKSLKELNLLSEQIIFLVLNQFCQEFHSFTSRSILRKKKQNTLPGLKVTLNSIKDYLSGLTAYMMQNYEKEVVRRFNLISPLSFLKIHHQYDDDYDGQIDDQDEQINMPIIPNTLFYEYQLVYEQQRFKIREEDKKYSNFLESLIKIHNLLLSNCLSEILQKTRIDRVVLPWDKRFDVNRHNKDKISKKSFENQLNRIISSISENAFTRVGQFHKRLDDVVQEQKLLKSISSQYKSEGNEWSAQYQYLELRMDLTKHIQEAILEQLTQDLMIFF